MYGNQIILRCGGYDALDFTGIDSDDIRYYDASGKLVGATSGGDSSGPPCVSYDPSFTAPPKSCIQVTPICENDDGGADLDGGF
jgi:hypothetical protein